MDFDFIYSINFWSALLGLLGSILIFFFGLPPKIDLDGHIHLILDQEDKNEKKKAKIYKCISYFGIFFLILSFLLQVLNNL